MAAMYSLPAYMAENVDPVPTDAVYVLPSYHRSANGDKHTNGAINGVIEMVDPAVMLEKKQLELIGSLTALGDKLNALLKQKGTAKPSNEKSVPSATQKPAAAAKAAPEDGKKDKDAKKEARKAAKVEAKNKVATGAQPAPVNGKAAKENGAAWTVKEDKKSTETGQSLTACLRPELCDFQPQALGEVKLIVSEADFPWVAALSSIGERRNVAFSGKVANKADKKNSSVSIDLGGDFSLCFKDGAVKSRVAAWEVLGAALGLYSFDSTQAIQAAHQHQWLVKADLVLRKQLDIGFVQREMSQFLSRFDTLGSQFNVGVADLVLRSLVNPATEANNVELWAGRVSSL